MSIKRIAQLAGVSPATVLRVLNNPEYRGKYKTLGRPYEMGDAVLAPDMHDQIFALAQQGNKGVDF